MIEFLREDLLEEKTGGHANQNADLVFLLHSWGQSMRIFGFGQYWTHAETRDEFVKNHRLMFDKFTELCESDPDYYPGKWHLRVCSGTGIIEIMESKTYECE